jgi:hypothetical protein
MVDRAGTVIATPLINIKDYSWKHNVIISTKNKLKGKPCEGAYRKLHIFVLQIIYK